MSHILAGLFGFVVGCLVIFNSWQEAAQRGYFEIGHKVYKAEVVRP